jgi:two-component sensor histidine kinase
MQTGAKLFLILSGALLPLAAIALFATLQTNRNADQQARAQLRVAATESSRALAIELIGDMTALRVALNTLDRDAGDAPACARAQGVFAQQYAAGARFAITDRQGRLLCGNALPAALTTRPAATDGSITARILPGRGLVLAMAGSRARTVATGYFPAAFLTGVSHPTAFLTDFGAALTVGPDRLDLTTLESRGPFERRERTIVTLGLGGLALDMSVRSLPISSPLIIALLLPILMWAAAAGISWFVVDRLLIRPLRGLRRSVAAYAPGEIIDPGEARAMPAEEIRELGETFRAISRTVALHEHDLAEGLVRQTRLTREVHHRVKNNLQVISSLINLHARGAKVPEAGEAYASIQRRVDALAVVHRNHFAEMEDNRGLPLRGMLGELASNIRATVPERSAQLGIALDIDPVMVNQDIAIAVAFLVTEIIELAMLANPAAQIRLSVKPGVIEGKALLRISSPALVDSEALRAGLAERYARVMAGLSRQLRTTLHHDPLVGAYEIPIAILGRE